VGFKEAIEKFFLAKGINVAQPSTLDFFSPSRIIETITLFLKGVSQALSNSLLLILIIVFMLLESSIFPVKLHLGLRGNTHLINQVDAFNQDIRRYVFITTWTGTLSAIAEYILMLFLGIDLAGLWAILFFLLNFIPGIGFLLAIIPPFLLALLEAGWQKALLLLLGCWLIDNVMDKGIKPRYMQEGLDLSPLVIFLSVLFWTWVLGATGALLAVPLTMMIKKLILESSEETRFLAAFLGAGETQEGSRQKGKGRRQ
jgi:predicted PurR-regulated permease PerM